MSVQSILLDFSVAPDRICEESSRKAIFQRLLSVLKEYIPNLTLVADVKIEGGSIVLITGKQGACVTVRFSNQGFVTMNLEYYKSEQETPLINFKTARTLEMQLKKDISFIKSQAYAPLKRCFFGRYFPTSDDRLLEYDIDGVLFDEQSALQRVQIVHSKTLGNMLVLDDLQNISEADLIYTETIMALGKENYAGKEIIILGGGDGALLYELLKEKPKFVWMLEIDDVVIKACNKHMKSICGDVLERTTAPNYKAPGCKNKGRHAQPKNPAQRRLWLKAMKFERRELELKTNLIIVEDCMLTVNKFLKEGKKVDYIFGDLTDIPISETDRRELWEFMITILRSAFEILKPDGKFMTHGHGANCPEALKLFEKELAKLEPKVNFEKTKAFIPSFMEDWVFYRIRFQLSNF